ncbi:J domain-containing protein [Paenibacillus athensensis]|uniref:J domain-containing protein n=1 Tax=Paenibacillus athensensis TaxID=1967502 RepID=A0A4Y8PZJ4_9BACL|nr:J domain-containing protein [Paenibacillus athensensis]MCD1258551.1 J domain-containing protein [Paenibacillus athensensis]
MNCWAVLGIARTTDTSIIKKAYKQQLLIHHPEDDPAGYQTVREAYAAAMNEAKRQAKLSQANAETIAYAQVNTQDEAAGDEQVNRRLYRLGGSDLDDKGDTETSGGRDDEQRPVTTRRYLAKDIHDQARVENDFMTHLARLYHDPDQRDDPEAWQALFSHDVLWDIQSKSAIDQRMLRFFSNNYNLNNNVWITIETHTGLFDKMTKNADRYSACFVDTYALATQQINVPSRRNMAAAYEGQMIKVPSVSWWRFCFRIPITWIVLGVIGHGVVIPFYLIYVLVRMVLFVKRRNWKIIMWEYTCTYVNSWGMRYDFKYIDIIKIVQRYKMVTVYLKNKKIRIRPERVHNLDQLLTKMSRYQGADGEAIIVRELG